MEVEGIHHFIFYVAFTEFSQTVVKQILRKHMAQHNAYKTIHGENTKVLAWFGVTAFKMSIQFWR
jgi:hypothetical protein